MPGVICGCGEAGLAGILLIMGIDQILDMIRTLTNVSGYALAEHVYPEGVARHPDHIHEVLGPGARASAALAWGAALRLRDPLILEAERRYGLSE